LTWAKEKNDSLQGLASIDECKVGIVIHTDERTVEIESRLLIVTGAYSVCTTHISWISLQVSSPI
jgi:hypothetical protein